jgi:hypothetical protein
MKSAGRILVPVSIVLLFALHLPFLHADPDYFLSTSRDAFTDEGLNTSQLRNFINHDYLSFDECDNLIKSPLFNLVLFLPLKLYGAHLVAARLTILIILLAALSLLALNPYFRTVLPVLAPVTLMQYYVFQYSHFSLSEMLAITCILCAVVSLLVFFIGRKGVHLFLSCLFFSAAWFAKIQFIYIMALPPAAMLAAHHLRIFYITRRIVTVSIIWIISYAFLYVAAWYLPHRDVFDYVLKDQSAGKFASPAQMPRTIGFNLVYVLFSQQQWWFHVLSAMCAVLGLRLFKSAGESFRIFFLITLIWLLIESHKLTMVYLPARYQAGFYFAEGLLSSVVLAEVIRMNTQTRLLFRQAGWLLLLAFAAGNGINYAALVERRAYRIEEINRYFSETIKDRSRPVLGVWSTTATWESRARTIPVWNNFMNDQDVLNQFQPLAILSEPDEGESNQAFSSKGIRLAEWADSTRTFQIGKWVVNVHWLR